MADRENLIALLNEIIDGGFKWHSHIYESGEQFDNEEIASYLIANGVTIQRWIPVEERLPEKWQNVLTVRTDGKIRFDFIGSLGVWCEDVNYVGEPVTHWMPLPQPPKEVE